MNPIILLHILGHSSSGNLQAMVVQSYTDKIPLGSYVTVHKDHLLPMAPCGAGEEHVVLLAHDDLPPGTLPPYVNAQACYDCAMKVLSAS